MIMKFYALLSVLVCGILFGNISAQGLYDWSYDHDSYYNGYQGADEETYLNGKDYYVQNYNLTNSWQITIQPNGYMTGNGSEDYYWYHDDYYHGYVNETCYMQYGTVVCS
jgi:hypothetical protein